MVGMRKLFVKPGVNIFLASNGDKLMTFYNYIENVRHEMFKLVNDWTHEGAETKARISESLDQARNEYNQLRELVYDMLEDEERGHNDDLTFYEHVKRANELGVEWK